MIKVYTKCYTIKNTNTNSEVSLLFTVMGKEIDPLILELLSSAQVDIGKSPRPIKFIPHQNQNNPTVHRSNFQTTKSTILSKCPNTSGQTGPFISGMSFKIPHAGSQQPGQVFALNRANIVYCTPLILAPNTFNFEYF